MSDKYPGGFVTANAPAGYSVFFDGTGDGFSYTGTTFGSGAWTVELWFYFTGTSFTGPIQLFEGTTNSLVLAIMSTTSIRVDQVNVSNDSYTVPTMSANTWYHVAATKDASGNQTLFLNGVRSSTGVTTTSRNFSTATLRICYSTIGATDFTGYISNLRFVTGTAVYNPLSTTINVPTQLFPISGTQLLICQSPTTIDNSSNAYTLTLNGTPAVSNFTPFAAYQGFNPALGAAAGGVWTIDEAAYYQQNRLWPIYDPYFNQTTLMLHGNSTGTVDSTGTPVYQNNTFLDSSTNNFTITRNGNTTQGSFSPFSQTGWSFYGTGATNSGIENLQSATSSQYAFGTGDWCVEMWFYRAGDGINPTFLENLIDMRDSDVQGNGVLLGARQNGSFWAYDAQLTTAAGVFASNTWNHVAYTRQNGAIRIIVNGILQAYNGAYTTNYTSTNCRIKSGLNAGFAFNGYVSNARVIKGNVPAQYQTTSGTVGTGVFTPPTAPLSVVTGTSLLTCQNSRLVDNSANNFALTVNGTPSVQAFSPFVPAYITPTTYSNWFDGTGDYLQIASATALQLNTSVAWTIEAWVYPTTLSGDNGIIAKRSGGSTEWQFSHSAGTGLTLYTGATTYFSGQTLTANKFQHVAITWDLTTLRFFIDGVQTPTTNTGISLPASNTYPVNIASNTAGGETWYGCISNLRLVKGTALYTAAFTPPTAPLTNITNTSLLTCQSSTFIDNSTANGGVGFTITANGNVQPVTSPTPFPAKVDTTTLNSAYSTSLIGGSGYFDGTTDYLTFSGPTIGTGAFCLEAWVYCTSTLSNQTIFGADGTNNRISIKINSSTVVSVDQYGVSASNFTVAAMALNAWNHIAVSRNGSSVATVFVNGVRSSTGTATLSNNYTTFNALGRFDSGTGYYLTGYIAGARAIIGSTPYDPTQTGFAPPVAPPTPVANTQFLTNFTNGAIFDNTAKNVLETVGNAQISTTQSKWGGSSMYFDGTGDWLLIPNNQMLNLNADFTIEFWIYLNSTSGEQCIFHNHNSDNNGVFVSVNGNGAGKIRLGAGNGSSFYVLIDSSTAISASTWAYVACTRSGSTWTVYINGSSAGTATSSSNPTFSTSDLIQIGRFTSGTPNALNAYIDDLRITKGVARYLTNFTPPTSQLQDQ